MSYLDRIQDCNLHDPAHFVPFQVAGQEVGWVKHGFLEHLARWPEVFDLDRDRVRMAPAYARFEARTEAMYEVLRILHRDGVVRRWHGERYAVRAAFHDQPLLLMDRASVAHFGIRAYGQHLNGYVREGGRLKMWVGRRAKDKASFPDKLDQLVAGGLPYGIDLDDNLAKESWEEASIPDELARRARPVGVVTYRREVEAGLKPDTLFNYDLELPADFRPRCNDGEMQGFELWPIERVMETVEQSEEFKLNCNLVVIDFLIRHGLIGPQHPDYEALAGGLHQ
jgi:hypothetical protein